MSKVTLVTGLWDLGRENLSTFKRSFEHYIARLEELLTLDINFVVFVPPELEKHVLITRGHSKRTRVIVKSLEDVQKWFPFYARVQEIRTSAEWLNGQPTWLPDSPQAALADYNPVIMSKMFMLNDASIHDSRSSDYYFWIDAGLTSTVRLDQLENIAYLPQYMADKQDKFVFLTYPYEGGEEIHGFWRSALHQYCQKTVTEIPRGGFFGGHHKVIAQMNGWYYDWLNKTLQDGNMGTEESVFCILNSLYSPKVHTHQVEGNGLIYPFFEHLQQYKTHPIVNVTENKSFDQLKTAVYILTYNSPKQVKWLLNSFEVSDNNFINKPDIYLIDNSTDPKVNSEYVNLCREYHMTHLKRDNIGICGARQLAADLFDQSDYDYYLFFEDDMFLFPPCKAFCVAGFEVYTSNLFNRSLEIIHHEKYDYLKLSFTEFYGTNKTQWAWYNVSQLWREHYFPEKPKLPVLGLDPNPPATEIYNQKSYGDLCYLEGEFFYCNWPLWMSREGNRKIFIDSKSAMPFEQMWMAETFYKQRQGQIRCAVLRLSPINHNRFEFYPAEQRKEC